MALTGAQVKQLRSMAHHLNPAIIIGKSDVNEGTVEQTVAYLEVLRARWLQPFCP